jgi:hypothetical protein
VSRNPASFPWLPSVSSDRLFAYFEYFAVRIKKIRRNSGKNTQTTAAPTKPTRNEPGMNPEKPGINPELPGNIPELPGTNPE